MAITQSRAKAEWIRGEGKKGLKGCCNWEEMLAADGPAYLISEADCCWCGDLGGGVGLLDC